MVSCYNWQAEIQQEIRYGGGRFTAYTHAIKELGDDFGEPNMVRWNWEAHDEARPYRQILMGETASAKGGPGTATQ